MEKKQIFIGSALTHLPKDIFAEYKELILDIVNLVEQKHGCIARYALEHSDPQLARLKQSNRPDICYKLDRYLVETSDLMIAEASFPSIGLGQELQIAENNKIPIILMYKDYKKNIAEEKTYHTRNNEKHSIEIGEHRIVSVMALGNPAKTHEIKYYNRKEALLSLDSFLAGKIPTLKEKSKHSKYQETIKLIERQVLVQEKFLNPVEE